MGLTLHAIAVWTLALFALLGVWQRGVELFVAWYSGAEPPLRRGTVVLLCCGALLSLAAAAVAVLTL